VCCMACVVQVFHHMWYFPHKVLENKIVVAYRFHYCMVFDKLTMKSSRSILHALKETNKDLFTCSSFYEIIYLYMLQWSIWLNFDRKLFFQKKEFFKTFQRQISLSRWKYHKCKLSLINCLLSTFGCKLRYYLGSNKRCILQ